MTPGPRVLLDLLVPPACLVCRAPGAELCPGCRRALPHLATATLCPRCALPAPCGLRCPAAGQAFVAAWAPFAHAGPARTLVAALKFRRAYAAAGLLAEAIVDAAPPGLLEGVVVPVPAHPVRRRRRGIDHARLLAEAVARRAGLRCTPRALTRDVAAGRQLGAGRAARLAARPEIVARPARPARILLVDDVHTTGATLDACSRALLAAGHREVVACTAVRTLLTADRAGR